MIAHSIEHALASRHLERVIVSTDDPYIAEIARAYGAETPFLRPKSLSLDDSPEWLAWRHAVQEMDERDDDFDVLVSIPTTAPLRAPTDIDDCLQKLVETGADGVITVTPAKNSPYFNMVTLDEKSEASLVVAQGGQYWTRQSVPQTYNITTVCYAVRTSHILRAQSLFHGQIKAVVVPSERALDIDDQYDLRVANLVLASRN